MPIPEVMSRVLEELRQERIRSSWVQELTKENNPLSEVLPYIYAQTTHSGDTMIAFPEDDFLDRRRFHSVKAFEQALMVSKLKEICPYIHGWRCGLPKAFCNQLLRSFK
jgi:hypothetical protein